MKIIELGLTKREAKQALPILKGALKLLETKGWCQGSQYETNDSGAKDRFCSLGAIVEAAGRKTTQHAEVALGQTMAGYTGGYAIIGYNDADHRRKPQVLAKFRQAIASTQALIN